MLAFVFLVISFFILIVTSVFAAPLIVLPDTKIPPESFYYPIKRLVEKIQTPFHITSSSKADYYKDLVQARMGELKHVVDKGYLDQVEKASQRVSFEVGTLTDYIKSNNLSEKKSRMFDLYKNDRAILENLRDKYPANSSFWMLIQHIINSIDLNLQKL